MDFEHRVKAGQAVYTPRSLRVYDAFVLGFSNRWLWRCPARELEAMYARNVSGHHLDIGVGTGYFLDQAAWPVANPDILLADLNPHSLAAAAGRISRYNPRILIANILEPLAISERFGSVGLCYLLHCLPGQMAEKAVVFDHLLPVLSPRGKVFGATIVQGDAPRSKPAQALMSYYNQKGIFSNTHDTAQGLDSELRKRFANVRVQLRGSVAIFEAQAREPQNG
ncbi:MAG: class I SAM-dependent methyltransferase [Hyphomicrobium sp.]